MHNSKDKISPRQALKEIQWLKNTFIGNRQELHNEIDRIIEKVK